MVVDYKANPLTELLARCYPIHPTPRYYPLGVVFIANSLTELLARFLRANMAHIRQSRPLVSR